MSDPENALTASSLLLTVLTLLYTVWSEPLKEARVARFSADYEERPNQREPVRGTLRRRAIPLAVGSWLAFAVFLPRALLVLASVPEGFGRPDLFDDVLAALVVSEIFLLGLALTTTADALAIGRTLKESWKR